jgi:hypothetical protein
VKLSFLSRPKVLLLYFPRLDVGSQDKPSVNELVKSSTDNLKVAGVWVGNASSIFQRRMAKNFVA